MLCKAYSVLVVICITCLLIFSKFDSDKRIVLFRYQYSFRNGSSTSLFIDTKLPSQHQQQGAKFAGNKVAHLFRRHNSSNLSSDIPENEGITTRRMDNNNIENEVNMGSPVKSKDQDQSPSPSEDTADGHFTGQFNIKMLNEHLQRCIRQSDHEIDMDEYILTFQQLYKFFCMLGTLFGFIGSDVKTKIEILQAYREGDNKTHYETVEKMVAYEKSTDFIHSNKESSGSRTFLRLHRSLIFVSKFLGKMDDIGDQDGISRICKDAYAQTLSKFHPWLIQKGAGIAMLGLPSKKDLIAKVCANGIVDCNEVISIMSNVIQLTSNIYDQCENIYTENDLHSLP